MKRGVTVALLFGAVALSAGCGSSTAPPDAADPSEAAAHPVPAQVEELATGESISPTVKEALGGLEASVSDMDLYMHDIQPTGDVRRTPTLWVHAAHGQLKADSSWALADASAVIYREHDEEIRLESKSGRFDESNKVAVLDGGVKVAAGGVHLSTDSVRYDNTHRVVQTIAPVELSDGKTTLNAEGATLEPEDGTVTLTNVSGTLSLDGDFE